jgi:hypothetical protein
VVVPDIMIVLEDTVLRRAVPDAGLTHSLTHALLFPCKSVFTMTDDASEGTPPKGACLHCSAEQNKIQVHCDSCGGFICSECHWCHEVSSQQTLSF